MKSYRKIAAIFSLALGLTLFSPQKAEATGAEPLIIAAAAGGGGLLANLGPALVNKLRDPDTAKDIVDALWWLVTRIRYCGRTRPLKPFEAMLPEELDVDMVRVLIQADRYLKRHNKPDLTGIRGVTGKNYKEVIYYGEDFTYRIRAYDDPTECGRRMDHIHDQFDPDGPTRADIYDYHRALKFNLEIDQGVESQILRNQAEKRRRINTVLRDIFIKKPGMAKKIAAATERWMNSGKLWSTSGEGLVYAYLEDIVELKRGPAIMQRPTGEEIGSSIEEITTGETASISSRTSHHSQSGEEVITVRPHPITSQQRRHNQRYRCVRDEEEQSPATSRRARARDHDEEARPHRRRRRAETPSIANSDEDSVDIPRIAHLRPRPVEEEGGRLPHHEEIQHTAIHVDHAVEETDDEEDVSASNSFHSAHGPNPSYGTFAQGDEEEDDDDILCLASRRIRQEPDALVQEMAVRYNRYGNLPDSDDEF